MKSVKIASLLLASGMLLGSVHSAVTPAYTAHAQTESAQRDASKVVTLEDDDVVVNDEGIITSLTLHDHTKLTKIFDSGELVIPEKLNSQTIKGVGDGVFYKNNISVPGLSNLSGIAKLTFEVPENILEIGATAFSYNAISGKLNLPNVTDIGNSAFMENKLTNIDLPNVTNIGNYAFYNNKLTNIDVPKVTDIGSYAFYGNRLMKVVLPIGVDMEYGAFRYQKLSLNVKLDAQGEVALKSLLPSLKIGDVEQLTDFSNVYVWSSTQEVNIIDEKITVEDKEQHTTAQLLMNVKQLGDLSAYSIETMTLGIYPLTATLPPVEGGNSGNSNDDISTTPDITPDSNTNMPNPTPETPIAISPDPEVNRPHTVYAKRAMRLHSNVSLTNPTKSYKKQSRAKAASFRIQGVSYDKNGKKRYKVNGGYITASSKYVADSHFRSSKVKQVRVIGNKVNSYKNAKLSKSQQVRSYKKGTKLKVKRIVKQGRTTRFQLNNGRYITGNKQLLIMDHSK
jgi:transcriptional regulator of met regulon